MPIDVHLMTNNPDQFLNVFARVGVTRVIPHIEATGHPHRLIMQIMELGMEAGIAMNPATRIDSIEYLLPEIDVVTLMAINPGIIGHKFIPSMMDKISNMRTWLDSKKYEGQLEVDGGVVFENITGLANSGADILVGGAGSVFHGAATVQENISRIKLLTQEINQ